eukprot:357554-Chlamydomonas_euryale.AAC.9
MPQAISGGVAIPRRSRTLLGVGSVQQREQLRDDARLVHAARPAPRAQRVCLVQKHHRRPSGRCVGAGGAKHAAQRPFRLPHVRTCHVRRGHHVQRRAGLGHGRRHHQALAAPGWPVQQQSARPANA